MNKVGKKPVLAFLNFFATNVYDEVKKEDSLDNTDTGYVRLKTIFEKDIDGNYSGAMYSLLNTSVISFFLGGIIGGIKTSRFTFINFIESNEATTFRSHRDAKRILSDKMFISFFKGFKHLGSRVSFFSTTFASIITGMAIYRNKQSVADYSVAGACTGALYKFNLGPKGMVSGGVVGMFFGTIAGGLVILSLKLKGKDYQDFLEQHKLFFDARKARVKELEKIYLRNMEEEEIKNLEATVTPAT